MRRILIPSRITLDLLDYERAVFIEEILKRTELMFGSVDPEVNAYGIVDKADPSTALSSDLRPFVVSVNTTDPSTVDVRGGTAVFQSGEIIVLDNGATRLAVPGGIGTKSYVYLNFSELETNARLTRYETLGNTKVTYLANEADYIKITTKNDYDALTADERALTILLAVVTVQEVVASGGGTTSQLVVDMTRSALTVNRPWFSAADIQHRSYLGTGVRSETNPHAMSLNDLSATSGFSLFQMHLDHGMVVSKDQSIAKLPGKLCVEKILAGAITQDSSGAVTGIIDAWTFNTSRFPTLVLRATDPTNTLDYAPLQVPRQNALFLLPDDQYVAGTDITVTYLTSDAAEPPTGVPLTSLTFKQPTAREALIAGGVALSSISNPTLTFENCGPIPSKYTVFMNSDAVVDYYPQTVVCNKKLTDIGFALQSFDFQSKGLSRLRVGLSNAVAGPSLLVRIQITGTDSAGTTISETVEFNSSWLGALVGSCAEEPNQFVYTTNYFATLTNYIVTVNTASGPLAAVTMWADLDPVGTSTLSDLLPISEIVWNGLQVCLLEDIRPINTTMHLPRVTKHAAGAKALAEETLVYRPGYLFSFWVEDFDQPKFITTEVTNTSAGTGLAPTKTKTRKTFDGLDKFDVYVSRPVAVEPHVSTPVALRFIPIEPNLQFNMLARYFDGSGAWSSWTPLGTFASPAFTIDLGSAVGPIIKWQVMVAGQCKGLVVVYVTDGPGLAASVVFDVGVFDDGAYT